MEKHEALSKMEALRLNVAHFLENPRGRFFDPKYCLDLFARFIPIHDELLASYPSLFGDLPKRGIPEPSKTSDYDGRGYIERADLTMLMNDLEYCISILSRMPAVEIPSMKLSKEGIFFAGQYFDALQKAGEILSQASKSIWIIDGYISEDVLSLLSSKKPGVEAKVLTKDVSSSVKVAAVAFNKQYGGLSIRTSQAFHDRFVVIDDSDFYHFGASLKDLGTRGFMFSRIEESQIIEALRAKWNQEWSKATQVI